MQVSMIPNTQDVTISFLPLAHMFERVVQVRSILDHPSKFSLGVLTLFCILQTVMFGAGAKVGFFQGDIRLLPDDMKTLQPTLFPVVPRLLNRIYDKVGVCKLNSSHSF